MEALQKKIGSVLMIVIVLILVVAGIKKGEQSADASTQETITADEAADSAYEKAAADVIFWYEDASYDDFFEAAAKQYYEKTGIKVETVKKDSEEYLTGIYDKTMQDDGYPDVYLISGDSLAEAYLYGLVAVNKKESSYENAADNAKQAASYQGSMLGYPLSYNTCLFIYQNGYFNTAPSSMQEIIDFSNENEPAENVEYLVEWDVNDPFYDFPFVANSVTFEEDEQKLLSPVYEDELYQQDLDFFESILSSFSVNAQTVSEENIVDNFKEGRTLCALVDTDLLSELDGYEYSITKMPDLNEELTSNVCALTELLAVNEFSKNKEQAAGFAEFVTVSMADRLHEMTGHYSVFESADADATEQTAYETYETAVLAPDSLNAKDFWVDLKETIAKYF